MRRFATVADSLRSHRVFRFVNPRPYPVHIIDRTEPFWMKALWALLMCVIIPLSLAIDLLKSRLYPEESKAFYAPPGTVYREPTCSQMPPLIHERVVKRVRYRLKRLWHRLDS